MDHEIDRNPECPHNEKVAPVITFKWWGTPGNEKEKDGSTEHEPGRREQAGGHEKENPFRNCIGGTPNEIHRAEG